jgi:competence protein ComEC
MYPLFFAALSFALGIAVAPAHPLAHAWLMLVAIPLLAATRIKGARATGLLLTVGLCGYFYGSRALSHPPPASSLLTRVDQLHLGPRDAVTLTGKLRDTPEVSVESVRCDLEAIALEFGDRAWPVRGGVRLFAYPKPADEIAGESDAPVERSEAVEPRQLAALQAGDAIRVIARVHHPHDYRDPGVADFTRALREQGIDLLATVKSMDVLSAGNAGTPTHLRAAIWSLVSQQIDRLLPPASEIRANALVRAMLLGDTARLDPELRTQLQIDGVYHIVVIAGLHIGVLALACFFLLGRLPIDRIWLRAGTLALLAGYVWTISGREPTLRALLMLALYLVAASWYRERRPLNAVGFAALVLLIWRPLDLFVSSFELSFAAATLLAGVAIPLLDATTHPLIHATRALGDVPQDERFSPRLAQFRIELRMLATRLGWLWRPLGWRIMPAALRLAVRGSEIFALSLVLQIGLAPLMIVYFHRANPWAALLNSVVVPLVSLLIPLAWIAVAGSVLVGSLTSVAGWLLHALCSATLQVIAVGTRLPAALTRAPTPPPWALLVFTAAAAFWIIASQRIARARQPSAAPPAPPRDKRMILSAWALAATAAFMIAAAPFPSRVTPGVLSVVCLDVGQGDSEFVSFPDGKTMLVDAGPRWSSFDAGEEVVSPFLWSLGLRRLDAVVLTHAHMDHVGGLPAVVRNFHPRELWVTRSLPQESRVSALLREAIAAGVSIQPRGRGDRFLVGDVTLDVLLPPGWYRAGSLAGNDDSLVIKLIRGQASVLLEGDAEAGGEALMLDAHPTPVSLLKVAHHGSKTSSTVPFLTALHPAVAVISVGADNRYGHPSPIVLDRLRQSGITTLRTDLDGAIDCQLDNSRLTVWLFRRYGESTNVPERTATNLPDVAARATQSGKGQ